MISNFSPQIVGDVGNPARLRTEARADGIDFGPIALHRDLRAAARVARDGHDLHGPVGNLRNFQLEQPLHESLGRARKDHLRPLRRLLDVEYVRSDEIVDAIGFAGNLLVEIHNRFVASLERDVHVALFVALHGSGHEIVELANVFVIDRVALRFTDALHDHLLGRLSGDPAEIFWSHLFVVEVADLIRATGPLHRDLELGILDFLDDVAAVKDAIRAALPVDEHDRVRFTSEVPFVRRQQRRLERFEQHLERDVALPRDELQDVYEFIFSSGVVYRSHVVVSVVVYRVVDRGVRRIRGSPTLRPPAAIAIRRRRFGAPRSLRAARAGVRDESCCR